MAKKKSVFKEICPQKHKNCSGIMTYSRYKYFCLPKSIKISLIDDYLSNESKKFILTQDIFQYNHDPSKQLTNNIYHYYVNFADKNLFGFYHGGLLAQDELMTLEHPILCSLREKLINLSNNIKSDYQPTCAGGACIILNAIRHGGFDDDGLKEIYGRKFGRSSSSRCIELVKIHKPPLKDNIIAIAGIMKMKQKYTQRDITYLLNVIYCGFNAAKLETIYDIKNRKQETSKIVNNESKDNDTELKESDSESKQNNNNNDNNNNGIISNVPQFYPSYPQYYTYYNNNGKNELMEINTDNNPNNNTNNNPNNTNTNNNGNNNNSIHYSQYPPPYAYQTAYPYPPQYVTPYNPYTSQQQPYINNSNIIDLTQSGDGNGIKHNNNNTIYNIKSKSNKKLFKKEKTKSLSIGNDNGND
mmetsp:Transcript_62074/g.76076  ORF Transcript_62074/g.76076 Transcript_62074/m.76076 type:complete len:414 (+) Transcript_62074:117-1358(+)